MATACMAKLKKRIIELEELIDNLIINSNGGSDDQNISLNGGQLSIEDGNTVNIAGNQLCSLFGQDLGTLVNDN